MLNKLPLLTVGMLLLETPVAPGAINPGATGGHTAATAAPRAGSRGRTVASAFAPTLVPESVALAAIWIGVAVLMLVGIASLFAPSAA